MANKHPKHILVISDPPAAPGYLPRLRYLCDFLVRKGYNVTLLTEQYQPLIFAHEYPIITIPMYTGGLFDWGIKTIWTLVADWHNKAFARRFFQSNKCISYDLVLCTAFSDFPLGAAKIIAQRLEVPLICDIRDLDEQVDNSTYQYQHQQWWLMPFRNIYRAIHIRRRNQVLRAANAITTVSPWHAEFIKRHNPHTYIVYNGFDEKQFYPENISTDTFTISYIGTLYDWQKPALEKVKRAIQELDSPIQFIFHTPTQDAIPHDQLGDAIRSSSIMLVLTNTNVHGMLTTKFYEALGCDKPVLCVPSDNGSLAELINYTNAGIATDDITNIKAFIVDKYNEWKENGYTRQKTQHRIAFSRQEQNRLLVKIIEKQLSKDTY